jgi:hypothetical protein
MNTEAAELPWISVLIPAGAAVLAVDGDENRSGTGITMRQLRKNDKRLKSKKQPRILAQSPYRKASDRRIL